MAMTVLPPLTQRKGFVWFLIVIGFLALIFFLSDVLLPFVAAAILAYLLQPLVERLHLYGISRSWGSLLVLTAFILVFVGVVLLLVPILSTQISRLIEIVPTYINNIEQKLLPLTHQLKGVLGTNKSFTLSKVASEHGASVVKILGVVGEHLLTSGLHALSLLSLIILTPIVAFYLLKDWPIMVKKLDTLYPRYYYATIKEQLRIIDTTLAGFIRGQLLVCVILGSFYGIALTLAGLDFGMAIGLLSGILSFIPYVGTIVGGLSSIGMAFAQFGMDDWLSVGIIMGVFVLGQFVEGNFLSPKLVGSRVNLHPVWVMLALFVGGGLFGFAGVLLAVPVAATAGVLIRFAASHYQRSTWYQHQEDRDAA
jgi:predicted PurR-regulated permease PerM